MPRSSSLPEFPVGIDLYRRSLFIAMLNVILWESANLFFDAFISTVKTFAEPCLIVQIPVSQGMVLSDASDDPNGTLVTGLQNRERPYTQVLS